jgi:hypothetical protein
MVDILTIIYTWDRYEMLRQSLSSMFDKPGMPFRLWVVEQGSHRSNMYGKDSGIKQLALLMQYYREGLIETLILNQKNVGTHHAINQLMSLAKLEIGTPKPKIFDENAVQWKITKPDFVFQSNDDMIFEPNWLLESYNALIETEDYPGGKIVISSPYHCVWYGKEIPTLATYKGYKLLDWCCGNTWFMRTSTWLDVFGFYRTDSLNDEGDSDKLRICADNNWHQVMTKVEYAHHAPEAMGKGKYHRSGHW